MKSKYMSSELLAEIYKKAWDEGIFIREWDRDGPFACAGSREKLEIYAKRLGWKFDTIEKIAEFIQILPMDACTDLGAFPANGCTREEACQTAVDGYKLYMR